MGNLVSFIVDDKCMSMRWTADDSHNRRLICSNLALIGPLPYGFQAVAAV